MQELIYETTAFLGRRLGLEAMAWSGNLLGAILWRLVPSRARIAREAIHKHLQLPPGEAQRIARASFTHNGRSFLEIMATHLVDWRFVRDRLVIPEEQRMRELAACGRPIVFASGHLGAWELQSGMLELFFPNRPRMVVVRRTHDHTLHDVTMRIRQRPHVCYTDHRQAAMRVLKVLKRGGAVAFLVDHNSSRDEAVFLPFLGETAAVNMGPALLAVRSEALIVPVVMLRDEGCGYIQHFGEPLDTRELTGDRQQRIEAAAVFYTKAIEEFVRRAPEQWFWMHRRWKTRPPKEDGRRNPQSTKGRTAEQGRDEPAQTHSSQKLN